MTDGLTASDVALLQGNNRNSGGFGNGDNAWWIVLFLIFGWGNRGWGNRGWGGNADNGGGTYLGENYALITDNATLERKIDGVYAGQCDSTFAIVQNLNNGFSSAQNTMTQGFAGLNTALVTQGYESRIATHGVSDAVKDCCCQTQQNIKDTQYAIATTGAGIQNQLQQCCCDVQRQIERGFADTNYNLAINTNSIVQNAHTDADRIIARLDAMENSRKDEKIAEQACMINNQYLLSQINRNPVPAYVVPNPYCCNNNCGCA